MAQNIYVAGAERGSGKSAIVFAIMEQLMNRSDRIGFFRPIVSDVGHRDPLIHLIATRHKMDFDYTSMYGCTQQEARELINIGRYDDLIKQILAKFKELEQHFDVVVSVGTDFKSAGNALEFDFNIDIANNLGCLILPVVNGQSRTKEQVLNAMASFHELLVERGSHVLAAIVNLVDPHLIDSIRDSTKQQHPYPTYIVPNTPFLSNPTLYDVARDLEAQEIFSSPTTLAREISHIIVAAMGLADFLPYLKEGSLIITPGDRADIVLGTLCAYTSSAYPQVSGMLLTGGISPHPSIYKIFAEISEPPMAILSVAADTYSAALAVNSVNIELSPENERKIALTLGVLEACIDMQEVLHLVHTTRSSRITPMMFEHEIIQKAKKNKQHIVLPEGSEDRILYASELLMLRGVCDLTLLGNEDEIRTKINTLGLQLENIKIIDPSRSKLRQRFADTYFELRKHKGLSPAMAYDTMVDVSYFGTMMVYHHLADGMVSGSVHTTQHTIRPSFEIIRTRPGVTIVSSVFFMCLEDRVLVYGDCAVNPSPTAEQLADIAISSAATAQSFGIEPCIAMLSYSTGESGKGEDVEMVRQATQLVKQRRPDLAIDGPLQYDAAVDAGVAKTKLPDSVVAGQATVFIFPDLNTGNNTYKAVQRSAGAVAIGPVLQGLKKPVNDLSRGCTVTDIVNTVAITAIQAQLDV